MQLIRFHDGSFVCHKITSAGFRGRMSAWYNADGTVRDVECFNSIGKSTRAGREHWECARRVGWRNKIDKPDPASV